MGFLRQEYWTGLPSLLQGIFLTQVSSSRLVHCRLFHLPTEPPEKPHCLEEVVYKDLNPGIAGKGWLTHPVSQSSPTRGSRLQKMGLVVPARCKEQGWVLRVRTDMGLELWLVF